MPALKRKPFRKEQQRNLSRHTAPDDFTPLDAYPELYDEAVMTGEEGDVNESQIAVWAAHVEEIKAETPGAESILQ